VTKKEAETIRAAATALVKAGVFTNNDFAKYLRDSQGVTTVDDLSKEQASVVLGYLSEQEAQAKAQAALGDDIPFG
jgi:hypothetical protein